MVKTIEELDTISQKLDIFIREYGNYYPDSTLRFIIENFFYYLNSPTAPDLLMQIYTFLGCQNKELNFYDAHINKIDEIYGLNKNILDIGGGRIPSFATTVALHQQKTKKGTITVYDPLIIKTATNHNNLRLYRKEFTLRQNINKFNLLVGILPCEATETIIRSSCKNQKNFYVAMCGCSHFSYDNPTITNPGIEYQRYIIGLTEHLLHQYDNGKLEVDYLSPEYGIEYPILYNRKK